MMRKNQLKRLSLDKLEQYSKSTTNGQMLIMTSQIIKQKNALLKEKVIELKTNIEKVRKETKKTIKHMNQTVRDQLEKRQNIILDKNTRPTHDDIRELTELYIFFEKQNELIHTNNLSIDQLHQFNANYHSQLEGSIINPQDSFIALDKEYERLNAQCQCEQGVLDAKIKQFQQFKSHIKNIHHTIEQYRVKYQAVESVIRERQRQLDHLATYFKTRSKEDQQNIERQMRLADVMESELLKTQSLYIKNKMKNDQLKIMEIQRCNTEQ